MTVVLDRAELDALHAAAEGTFARHWRTPQTAGAGDHGDRLAAVWEAAVAGGWTTFAGDAPPDGAVAAVLAVAFEAGRAGCPFPVGDVFVTASLIAKDAPVGDGSLRAVVVSPSGGGTSPGTPSPTGQDATAEPAAVFPVEAAAATTHAFLLPAGAGVARLVRLEKVELLQGLAAPPWGRAAIAEEVTAVEVDGPSAADARAVVRLALAASALGAAGAAHALALAHARERRQFGRVIGGFQAVAHRLVDSAIDLTGGRLLLEDAGRRHDAGRGDWRLAAALAATAVLEAAPRIQLAAHHTLAASGYFDDHPAPWLFRRVHADVIRAATLAVPGSDPIDLLLARDGGGAPAGGNAPHAGCGLPALDLGPAAERTRERLLDVMRSHPAAPAARFGVDDPAFVGALADAGFLTPDPATGVDAAVAIHEELAYHRAPCRVALAAATLFGPAIARYGSPEQQQRFLPRLARGELRFYLGYSEPEVGSDLASLTTKAVRDGDEWVITGQKSWGTGADVAEWVWLAARTDPDATRPQDGITVFLFPTGLPGWEAQPHTALSGEVSCSTFFDGVRVPDTARVGEVNKGWAVITSALAGERLAMAAHCAELRRQFDDLLAIVRATPDLAGPAGSAHRARWSALAARLQMARLLLGEGFAARTGPGGGSAAGGGSGVEVPMAKVVTGELAEEFGQAALQLLGPGATLAAGQPGAVGDGHFEFGLRLAPMYVIGGGTADVQRNLIARALGLPRSA